MGLFGHLPGRLADSVAIQERRRDDDL
jgi:hypothetical protein